MLRVRPILFTSRPDAWSAVFTALGLACAEDHGGWRVFGSANGRVGLRRVAAGSADDGATRLGFEIRDREVFVRRTLADGTRAELVETGHGPSARVTAPDGFSFLADPVADATDDPGEAGPAATGPAGQRDPGRLTVVQLWRTPEPDGARKVLADIGARPVPRSDGHAAFRAKNGGLVVVQPSPSSGVVPALEYDGDLAALRTRLTSQGLPAAPDGGGLAVQVPDGALRITADGAAWT
ncbi:hypothetical protein B5P43_24035 [Bacillus sp. SRB_336]|nr:hypothetical protein B5P43_24035 [Bacillus sp. SRB_336]